MQHASCVVVSDPLPPTIDLSPAEDAVLSQVRDTIVEPREELARCVAFYLNGEPSNFSVEECLRAIESLLQKGILIELTPDDIAADLDRWKSEPLPVSWGVDRRRRPGDIDL